MVNLTLNLITIIPLLYKGSKKSNDDVTAELQETLSTPKSSRKQSKNEKVIIIIR